MKLRDIEQRDGYRFRLVFENGEAWEADLKDLIGQHVPVEALPTARIDPDWGCLEFLDGRADVEPKTLYRFVCSQRNRLAA